jgi:predicted transporter
VLLALFLFITFVWTAKEWKFWNQDEIKEEEE